MWGEHSFSNLNLYKCIRESLLHFRLLLFWALQWIPHLPSTSHARLVIYILVLYLLPVITNRTTKWGSDHPLFSLFQHVCTSRMVCRDTQKRQLLLLALPHLPCGDGIFAAAAARCCLSIFCGQVPTRKAGSKSQCKLSHVGSWTEQAHTVPGFASSCKLGALLISGHTTHASQVR